ncbi:hypothetical protein C8R45DRAFT_1084238 [Mycena sanguinolenta]|nr:hypothetical protein C8R45DRAFT_1084238 [Mycena sanguinolenta]
MSKPEITTKHLFPGLQMGQAMTPAIQDTKPKAVVYLPWHLGQGVRSCKCRKIEAAFVQNMCSRKFVAKIRKSQMESKMIWERHGARQERSVIDSRKPYVQETNGKTKRGRRSTEGAELVPDKVGAVAGKKYSGRRARARNALRGSAKTGSIGQDDDPRSDLKPKLEYTDSPRWAASGNPSARRNIGRNRRRAGWQGDDSRTLRREHGKVALPERSQGRQKVGTKSADGGVNCELNDSFKEPQNEDVLAQIKKNLEGKYQRAQKPAEFFMEN